MTQQTSDLFRINTRISKKSNEWLDRESAETGISKSTLILLAVENFIQQKETMNAMSEMSNLVERLERIENKI